MNKIPSLLPAGGITSDPGLGQYSDYMLCELLAAHEEKITLHQNAAALIRRHLEHEPVAA